MSDIIRLLPDTVANQIAAGEVIQRPASAVKEMLENSVDSGASRIQLILLDAGKTLIQVIDDGCGMSETDARTCFERHATSKIRKIDDLFTLHTMGFRGEALASIASVAQVELKTRRKGEETGIRITMEGGSCIQHAQAAVPEGTSIAVKNLFFNVPARRNFLKSNPVETRHIQEEFIRVALANPHIHFSLHHNETQVEDLRAGNFRQRITALFGGNYNERLVPVEEDTTVVRVEGYIGKPEFAKKNRGEQYFFVNNRFIKDPYLNHAVTGAFESLIQKDAYPSYWLKLTVDPSTIDVNIHPTKTEIKFQHEKEVYAILRAAVKRALGKYSVSPSLDFDKEPAFDLPLEKLQQVPVQPVVRINPHYNPFRTVEGPSQHQEDRNSASRFSTSASGVAAWLDLHREKGSQQVMTEMSAFSTQSHDLLTMVEDLDDFRFVQCGERLALAAHSRGLILIDIPSARERILYERFMHSFSRQKAHSQQQLFPPQINLNPEEYLLIQELESDLRKLGFDITPFGKNTIVVHGVPAGLEAGSEQATIQQLLEQFRMNKEKLQLPVHENLARSLARGIVNRESSGKAARELRQLAIDLLHCDQPFYSLSGKPLLKVLDVSQSENILQSNI